MSFYVCLFAVKAGKATSVQWMISFWVAFVEVGHDPRSIVPSSALQTKKHCPICFIILTFVCRILSNSSPYQLHRFKLFRSSHIVLITTHMNHPTQKTHVNTRAKNVVVIHNVWRFFSCRVKMYHQRCCSASVFRKPGSIFCWFSSPSNLTWCHLPPNRRSRVSRYIFSCPGTRSSLSNTLYYGLCVVSYCDSPAPCTNPIPTGHHRLGSSQARLCLLTPTELNAPSHATRHVYEDPEARP